MRRGNYKLIYFYEDQSFKLFDLGKDMGESKDLSRSRRKIAAQMLKELKDWTTECVCIVSFGLLFVIRCGPYG